MFIPTFSDFQQPRHAVCQTPSPAAAAILAAPATSPAGRRKMGEGDGGKRMKTRKSALCALGLAAALTLGGAVTASAQVTDTTGRARPQTRIPIRKDQPAPPPRVDTVTVTRT